MYLCTALLLYLSLPISIIYQSSVSQMPFCTFCFCICPGDIRLRTHAIHRHAPFLLFRTHLPVVLIFPFLDCIFTTFACHLMHVHLLPPEFWTSCLPYYLHTPATCRYTPLFCRSSVYAAVLPAIPSARTRRYRLYPQTATCHHRTLPALPFVLLPHTYVLRLPVPTPVTRAAFFYHLPLVWVHACRFVWFIKRSAHYAATTYGGRTSSFGFTVSSAHRTYRARITALLRSPQPPAFAFYASSHLLPPAPTAAVLRGGTPPTGF